MHRLTGEVLVLQSAAPDSNVTRVLANFRNAETVNEKFIGIEIGLLVKTLVGEFNRFNAIQTICSELAFVFIPGNDVPAVAVLPQEIGVDTVCGCIGRDEFPMGNDHALMLANALQNGDEVLRTAG